VRFMAVDAKWLVFQIIGIHLKHPVMEDAIRTRDVKSLVKSMISHISAAEISTPLAFDGDINRLMSLKELLNLSVAEIDRSIAQTSNEEARKVGTVGEAYIIIEEAQLIEPRGRFTVSMSLDGMLLEGKQVTTFVPWPKISHCACLPSTISTKREGEELLAILLGEPVKYNNKDITTLLWNLSKSVIKPLNANLPAGPINGTEHYVVSTLLSTLGNQRIVLPDRVLFQSVASKKPFLKCYRGIQEGSLYPLKNGMIFLKPILFIPTEKIASLTAGRGGGSGTRYIDLMVQSVNICSV
jgi:Histone chaperone Rttp106-like